MDYIRAFFRRRSEARIEKARKEGDGVRLAFARRYLAFKTLLGLNDRVLEIMGEMERALDGEAPFGMAFVRARCTALSVAAYKIIEALAEVTGRREEDLAAAFDDIRAEIEERLARRKALPAGPLVVGLDEAGRGSAESTGPKMACLGEAKNALDMCVPDGFVVTSAAYGLFMEKNGLQEEIDRIMQSTDASDVAGLHEASAGIQRRIVEAPLPPELEEAILSACGRLAGRLPQGTGLCLRSSALGEDGFGASFAGQYRSCLNVAPDLLVYSYKEVVASKYSAPAIVYRANMGFLDEDIAMCVGCMPVVAAEAAGVAYSADPGGAEDGIVINAAFGLGKAVVDGSVDADLYVADRRPPHGIIKKRIGRKERRVVAVGNEGVALVGAEAEDSGRQALSDGKAAELAGLVMRLEAHFGAPQDVEWAADGEGRLWVLQTRPLALARIARPERSVASALPPPIVSGGVTASPGAAYGPAFHVETAVDMLRFPEKAVIVAKNPLPQWAALLGRASALVSEGGGPTGHLAACCREFRVPAITGMGGAFDAVLPGAAVTVDADGTAVYPGRVEALLSEERASSRPLKESPVGRTLADVLACIAPLNLTDPDSPGFRPSAARTIHDVIRYAHECSLRELFEGEADLSFPKGAARRLVSPVPMEWFVLDLEGGVREGAGPTIGIEDVTSAPMLALWEGITAFEWKGPPAAEASGFASIVFEAALNPGLSPAGESAMGGTNYLVVSGDFFHLSTKLGFHYSTVEAFIGERAAESYVWFYFKGGAADRERKERRGGLIREVLDRFRFWTQVKGDIVSARIERQERGFMMERLKVLGYLLLHTRQLDMVMTDPGRAKWYAKKMTDEIATFVEARP